MNHFLKLMEEQSSLYRAKVNAIDPDRIGLMVQCPACSTESWVLLPQENVYFIEQLSISCPAACGHYSDIDDFSPRPSRPYPELDTDYICRRDETHFRTSGVIHRCPLCAIENPREIMNECALRVLASTSLQPNELADQLGSLVATFDGVMRQCNRIAQQNSAAMQSSHPRVRSFQDVASARQALSCVIDISKLVKNWSQFNEMFQKRHALSHNLGVIDQKFVDKAGVDAALIGRKVRLSKTEIDQFARDCQAIVRGYFGHFLS